MVELLAVVDGLLESDDPETANYDSAGQYPPFRIFIPNAQAYLRGDYPTRQQAQDEADLINGGAYVP